MSRISTEVRAARGGRQATAGLSTRRRQAGAALLIGLALIAAACGSSSKSNSSATTAGGSSATSGSGGSGSGGSGGKAPSGTPIKLGVIAPIQSSSVSQPYIRQAAKIAAAAVNADGGIDGRPVQIDFCDDQGTPQTATLCAQKLLVQNKDLMLVGGDGTQDAAVIPVLNSTNTIAFGDYAASQASAQSPRVYILGPQQFATLALAKMLPPTVKNFTYLVADSPIAQASEKSFAGTLNKSIKLSTVSVSLTQTSMQPTCIQIKSQNADAVFLGLAPGQPSSLINSCVQLGLTKLLYTMPQTEASPDVLQAATTDKVQTLVSLTFSSKALNDFQADVAKYGPSVGGISDSLADVSVETWMSVKLLPSVIQGAGSVNASAIQAWLNKQTAFNTNGATAPINYAATPVPSLPRIKNLSAFKGAIQNGKLVQTDPNAYTGSLGS